MKKMRHQTLEAVHTHTHTHKDSSKIILKQNNLFLILIISVFTLFLTFGTTLSKAALQANGNTAATKNLGTWITTIRDMEGTGGTLGLSETKNGTSLISTSGSNNLDIHMEKNSEYGAMAILSASSYGKQTPVANGETTTGNKSGVVINLNKEWVSAGTASECSQYVSADSRYKDIYTTAQTNKNGDALLETSGWHSSGASTWFTGDNNSGMLRAYSGSLFSFYGYGSYVYNIRDANYGNSWASRACVVVGENL